jgi:hypothetical protein
VTSHQHAVSGSVLLRSITELRVSTYTHTHTHTHTLEICHRATC